MLFMFEKQNIFSIIRILFRACAWWHGQMDRTIDFGRVRKEGKNRKKKKSLVAMTNHYRSLSFVRYYIPYITTTVIIFKRTLSRPRLHSVHDTPQRNLYRGSRYWWVHTVTITSVTRIGCDYLLSIWCFNVVSRSKNNYQRNRILQVRNFFFRNEQSNGDFLLKSKKRNCFFETIVRKCSILSFG